MRSIEERTEAGKRKTGKDEFREFSVGKTDN
jgi:hypothetical protein